MLVILSEVFRHVAPNKTVYVNAVIEYELYLTGEFIQVERGTIYKINVTLP